MAMRYRTFGKTGLKVSEISLGGLFFGKLAEGRDTAATVRKAADLGINVIDTAAAYGGSEEDLGRAMTGALRDSFHILTKWWPYMDDGKTIKADASALRTALEDSLSRLRTDRVEVLLFHSVTHPGNVDDILNGPLWPEVQRLKNDGKIRFVGLSNSGNYDTEDDRLQEAARSDAFDVVMPEFLLFRQRAVRGALPVFARHQMGVISIIPLGQAAWGYGLRDRKYLVDSLKTLREKGALPNREPYTREDILDFLLDGKTTTIAGAALRFCLSFPEISTVCCGTNNPEHLAENAAVAEAGPYPADALDKIKELFGAL